MKDPRLGAYAHIIPGFRKKAKEMPEDAESKKTKAKPLTRQQRRDAARLQRKARRSRLRLHGGWKVRYSKEYYE